MDGEVSAQVAPPIFLRQGLPGRFHEAPSIARKRDLPWQCPSSNLAQPSQQAHQSFPNSQSDWNPRSWVWDSAVFIAKPAADDTPSKIPETEQTKEKVKDSASVASPEEENLTLKLGGRSYPTEEPAARPNKRVRSGSPGSSVNCPTCQVDDCKADLSNAKDYHRRHKVCEVHSKTTKAMVGSQMQRFCQQCSRFHLLAEFDEGKRSCRRRLAGHNRRRRKTQQTEDASSRLLNPTNGPNSGGGDFDLVNLLTAIARLQGRGEDPNSNSSPCDKDGLLHLLSKIKVLTGLNPSTQLPKTGIFDLNVSQGAEVPERLPRAESSAADLLAVLTAALKVSGGFSLSQGSMDGGADDKTKINPSEPSADANSQARMPITIAPPRARDFSERRRSSGEVSLPSLQLQLFSSPEESSPPKIGSRRKYLSSESSNLMEDGSHSSSPPVERSLFPLQSGSEALRLDRRNAGPAEGAAIRAWGAPLERFKEGERRLAGRSLSAHPYQAGYASSSGSDQSPASSHSDVQDRTGRIIFKLFDKDPSNFPPSLRTEILTWLSRSPSEIESYIRPGCVVLSIYLAMPSFAWEELDEEFLRRVNALVQRSESDLWRSGRFLVHTDRQLASHKDGKIRRSKSWKSWTAPELTCVSPVAVVGGEETTLVLKGRNLTASGTRVHCTYMGGYLTEEIASCPPDDESTMAKSFVFPGGSPGFFGRCFIEVENGLNGNSFPLIVADGAICRELRHLEPEMEAGNRSREDAIHFLNELGWLFQRRRHTSDLAADFSTSRFKFLFVFAIEKDLTSTVRKLLDFLAEKPEAAEQSLDMLAEIQLLHRAVKRKCRKMVDLLVHYSVKDQVNASRFFPFPPDLKGHGGFTPLHLAASMQDAEDIIDALTNDPQQKGLTLWESSEDDNGETPQSYAAMRGNQAYNELVTRKIADRKNSQVSIAIVNGGGGGSAATSCALCVASERTRKMRSTPRPQGLLQRPYVHSMLAIAAVCVCVCLFLRGAPELGSVAPFKWETLGVGTM